MFDKVVKMYEYMFAEVSRIKNYTFTPTDKQTVMINNFINKKGDSLGDNWLFNFFLFQFNRYHDKKTRFSKGIVQLSWVIGNKALKNWESKSDEEQFYVDRFRLKFNLKNPLIIRMKLNLSSDYLNIKRKSKNIVECNRLKLYEDRNIICRICSNKPICKEL